MQTLEKEFKLNDVVRILFIDYEVATKDVVGGSFENYDHELITKIDVEIDRIYEIDEEGNQIKVTDLDVIDFCYREIGNEEYLNNAQS